MVNKTEKKLDFEKLVEVVGSCIIDAVSALYSRGNFLRPVIRPVKPVVVLLLDVLRGVGGPLPADLGPQGCCVRVRVERVKLLQQNVIQLIVI